MPFSFLKNKKVRKNIIVVWFAFLVGVFLLYFFEPTFFHTKLKDAVLFSPILGYGLYLLIGCLRGFTLIPSTSLILLGMLFFPPWPLFVLTLLGILVSSASVFTFPTTYSWMSFLKRPTRSIWNGSRTYCKSTSYLSLSAGAFSRSLRPISSATRVAPLKLIFPSSCSVSLLAKAPSALSIFLEGNLFPVSLCSPRVERNLLAEPVIHQSYFPSIAVCF